MYVDRIVCDAGERGGGQGSLSRPDGQRGRDYGLGIYISGVDPYSVAENAGLKVGAVQC